MVESAFDVSTGKQRILVVEDNEKSRMFLEKISEDLGCSYVCAETGTAALEILNAGGVDLALLDILIPSINGYQILEIIRKNKNLWDLPVVVITGIDSVDSAVRCMDLGATDYITKPYNPVLLRARLRSLLEKGASREREGIFRKRIEEQNVALAERERYYRGVVEDQTELICRFDQNMSLSFANGAYCKFFESSFEEAIGGKLFGDDGEDGRQALRQTLSATTPDNPVVEIEMPLRLADGRTKWLEWTNRGLFGPDAALLEYQSVGRDITERRLMENALREREKDLNKAQTIAHLGYLRWRPGSDRQVWSDQVYKIFGYDAGEVEPTHASLFDVIDPDDLDKVLQVFEEAGNLRGGFDLEFRVVRKDGGTIYVNLNGEIVLDTDGNVSRVEGVIQDITKRKQTERQLTIEKDKAEAATKVKDKFISLVSHDLRAPLGAVQGLLELVEEGTLPREKERDFVHRAADNCKKLLRTLDNLLNLNNIRSGVLTPEIRKVLAREMVEAAWDKLRHLAVQKEISLVNRIDPKARINADPHLAEQVLSNILHNALKFSHMGGAVTVSAPTGEQETIEIRDEGMGMEEETRVKLFTHGSNVSAPGTAGERGTGLGLALSQDIIKAHGGSIEVESMPDAGCVFRIKFTQATPTLLIVDDDEDFRLLMRSDLEELKAKIVEASDAVEALEIASNEPVSLMITDLAMPGMNGLDLVTHIRKKSKAPSVPAIIISVSSDYQTKVESIKSGVNDFLTKPVEKKVLLAAVRKQLKNL
ncbi:MAG: response regulator [Nitrospinota bacterium]|nr:response regulator [Nitrospinota bacterium]